MTITDKRGPRRWR